MQPEALREAHEWLDFAERDLLIAELALESVPPLTEHTAYHAHQAAEKALKSYLAAHSTPFPKTHELVLLVSMAQIIDASFAELAATADALQPYGIRFRYPGGPPRPEREQALEVIALAAEIYDFVRQRIPAGT